MDGWVGNGKIFFYKQNIFFENNLVWFQYINSTKIKKKMFNKLT